MSIQGLRRRFAAHFKYVLYALVAVFTVGLALLFTPGSGILPSSSQQQAKNQTTAGANDIIAKAGGVTLRRSDYDASFTQQFTQMAQLYRQMGMNMPVTLGQIGNYRLQAVQGAIQEQLILADAKTKGISASRGEVKKRIQDIVDQNLASLKQQYKGQDFEKVLGALYSQSENTQRASMSEGDFRSWLSDRAWSMDRKQIENEIITDKLRAQVAPRVPISDQELKAQYDTVTSREILVSLNPKGKPARTDAQAKQRAEELLAKAKQGDFAVLAKAESDDPNAKQTGGLRPNVPLSNMDPALREVVAPAKVGDIVGPIKMSYGYLVVQVEKRASNLPKDFEKNQKQYQDSAAQQKQSEAWTAYTTALQQKAKLDIVDPEMRAYEALSKGQSADALKYLQQAVERPDHLGPIGAASVYYQLATIYASHKEWAKAEQSYELADNQLSSDQAGQLIPRKDTLYGMATAYQQMNKPDDAATWYMAARDQIADDPQNEAEVNVIHQQITAMYQKMGAAGVAKQKVEDQWMADYRKSMEEKQKAAAAQRAAQLKAAQEAQKKAAPTAPTAGAAKPAAAPAGEPGAAPAKPTPAPK